MKKLVLLSILSFVCVGFVNAQVPVRGRPQATPLSPSQKALLRANDISVRSNQLKNMENHPIKLPRKTLKLYKTNIFPLYRKPTKAERQALIPNEQDLTAYSQFRKGKRKGIIKLVADIGCAKNPKIVVASIDCAKYTMPGSGSAFSFRFGNYRMLRIADLNFKKNTFQALGVLTHGILVNMGDVRLNQVNVNTNGMQFITNFKPVKNMSGAANFASKLTKGIEENGFKYGSVLPVKMNSTYVLRSVAYRGFAWRKVAGIAYNELGRFGDKKRKDVIIAFRVIRFVPNEAVTIVWKQLKSKNSPEIKK